MQSWGFHAAGSQVSWMVIMILKLLVQFLLCKSLWFRRHMSELWTFMSVPHLDCGGHITNASSHQSVQHEIYICHLAFVSTYNISLFRFSIFLWFEILAMLKKVLAGIRMTQWDWLLILFRSCSLQTITICWNWNASTGALCSPSALYLWNSSP